MAKSFKLRISRVITTTFQSCRSKDPSTLPQNPVPSFFRFTPLLADDFPAADNPPSRVTAVLASTHRDDNDDDDDQHHRSSFRRNVSTASSAAFISRVGGCGFSSTKHDSPPDDGHQHHNSSTTSSQQFKWRKEEKWHVVAKIYEKNQTPRSVGNPDVNNHDGGATLAMPPPPAPPLLERKKTRGNKKKKISSSSSSSRFRMSTSSAESGMFSSEVGDERDEECDDEGEEEETETLVSSSRSFCSTDSSSLVETIREIPFTRCHRRRRNKNKTYYNKKPSTKRSLNCRPSSWVSVSEAGTDSPARLSVFKKLIPCTVDGKVKDSFAIVKKSEDPYEDFKRSMMEMILEKQMFEEKDLEQLLQCFLSLNSRHYHGLIVQAFADIWEAMFCSSSARRNSIHPHHQHQHQHRRVGFPIIKQF